jgi:arabinan endo-1,5-alpha-L-arabinosidase
MIASLVLLAAVSCRAEPSRQAPVISDVTVHDPMVIRAGGTFYVFGSHLAAAKSQDLMSWELIAAGVRDGNPLIPNVRQEMREALEWGQSRTFWAGCVTQLKDGRFYFYYSVCRGDSPRSALGLAVAEDVEGPYKHEAILLRSGMWNQPSEDGTIYDATRHPNTIDPHVFYDNDDQLWMVYGSYSGGIFILRMNEQTGRPIDGQGYGKKLLGGNHSRIEAPYILYSPDTGYYYLFLSFGGLTSDGGYNIRVARSRQPDGLYHDAGGNDMIDGRGPDGSFFDDRAIEPYGVKLIGSFRFLRADGEPAGEWAGYVSPGHNSAFHDPETGKYFIIFHTRFPGRGEMHQVRVHQIFMNSEGWPVMAPHRYAGEALSPVTAGEVAGPYMFIKHGRRISSDITGSQPIQLLPNGEIACDVTGTWQLTGDAAARLTVDDEAYDGIILRQWDQANQQFVMTFSAVSDEGVAIWGSRISVTPPESDRSPPPHR